MIIVSDEWSDSQRRPLINFMATIESRPMFFKSIDGSDEIKEKYFIVKHKRDVIIKVEKGYEWNKRPNRK